MPLSIDASALPVSHPPRTFDQMGVGDVFLLSDVPHLKLVDAALALNLDSFATVAPAAGAAIDRVAAVLVLTPE